MATSARSWVEVGGALRRYEVNGVELLDGYGEDEMCSGARGQPLIPWPNRLRDGRYEFDGATQQLPLSEADRVTLEHVLHPQAGPPRAISRAVARGRAGMTAPSIREDHAGQGAASHARQRERLATPAARLSRW
jgi:aldose 1-epimerase